MAFLKVTNRSWKCLLASSWAGVNLQRNNSSELPSEAKIFRPVLQPSESVPPIGTCRVEGENNHDYREVFADNISFYKCVFRTQEPTCWTLWKGVLASKLPWEWSTSSPNRRSGSVCVLCVLRWPPFQLILHNMCVCVSMCVWGVTRKEAALSSFCSIKLRGVSSGVTRKPSLFSCVSDLVL